LALKGFKGYSITIFYNSL